MGEISEPCQGKEGEYRLLEHTADMGIEARAATLEALFVAAARGLREMIFGPRRACESRTRIDLYLEGGDIEELLVAWLGEILFIVQQQSFCPAVFHVVEIDGQRLKGWLSGASCNELLQPLREIKAVTYHLIHVRRQQGVWRARVYVDL